MPMSFRFFALLGPISLGLMFLGSLRSEEARPAELRLGAARTLLRGGDPAAVEPALKLISKILLTQTGVHVQCVPTTDGHELVKELEADNVALGFLPGIELAWLNKRTTVLEPMLLTCNEKIGLRAFLVVRGDSGTSDVAGLKNKRLSFPKMSFNHCYFFLDKAIRDAGHNPATFFATCSVAGNPDLALEAVLEGEADATVIDEVGLEVFRDRKPGRAKRFRILAESKQFPCSVIVCRPNVAKTDAVRRIQEGLATAHQRPEGRQMLSLMRLSSFRPVTKEYEQLLKDIVKEYPEPVEPVNFTQLAVKETTQQK